MYFDLLNIDHFLSTYYVPGMLLAVNKVDKNPCPHEVYIQVGGDGQCVNK